MLYSITITGDVADQASLEKAVDVFLPALRSVATAEASIEYPATSKPPVVTGPVDFAREPVALVIDLTDQGPIVSASVRDGSVAATGATADDAMAAVAQKAIAQETKP